eukprot:jgi/Psemu1/52575/gm1.52575_g
MGITPFQQRWLKPFHSDLVLWCSSSSESLVIDRPNNDRRNSNNKPTLDYRRPNALTRYVTKKAQRAYVSITKERRSVERPTRLRPTRITTRPNLLHLHALLVGLRQGPTCLSLSHKYSRATLPALFQRRFDIQLTKRRDELLHLHGMNYREFFQGRGPFGEAPAIHDIYPVIYTLFTEADGDWLLPLLLDVFNAQQAIGGLGIFQEDAAGLDRLRVIHGLRRYPGNITQPSANQGSSFGYIDDVEGQEGELVQAAISQHPDRDYIPAIPEGTAHTEMLQAHKVCFLPFEFVPLVLCRGLTPKQAFQVLQPHIHQQGLGDICKPLLDTLRAVGTQPTTLLGAIRLLEPCPSFQAEASLRAYMKKNVLLRDLPGIAGSAPADSTLTAAFSALTDHHLRLSESLDQRRQESSKLHSVREVWGALYTERLLLLCGKTTEADLPPIYTAWDKKSKHEKTHMILQSQVATDAYNLGIQAPLITTAVLKQFQDCNFYGTDPFDVADGILPPAFTPPGGSVATLKREHEEAATDSLELQKTKSYIPLDWTEATTQLKSYLAVLATLLGATHDVWQQMPLRRAIADEVGEIITPAIVVYYFQIRVQGWLEEQWESDVPLPSPDFGEDIHRFRMTQNLNWLPNVSS